jgi:hypothetical protein
MRIAVGALTLGAMLIASAPPAQALTCARQAAICVSKGGSKAGCYGSVASCKKTCIFVGTDGRSWPADGDCRRKR